MRSKTKKTTETTLSTLVGIDNNSEEYFIDLSKYTNLLIIGDSATGKTNFMENMILSLGKNTSPELCQIVIIGPSYCDYDPFDGLKHISAMIGSNDAVIECLKNVQEIMEDRYRLLSKANCRNLDDYNKKSKEKLPHIIIFIDEIAPFMIFNSKEICSAIERICQTGKVPGVHLIISTKELMPEVFNAPIRYLFKDFVTFNISRPKCEADYIKVYLDGIEPWKLKKGDHILKLEYSDPMQLTSKYITDEEIENTVKSLKKELSPTVFSTVGNLFNQLFGIANKESNDE